MLWLTNLENDQIFGIFKFKTLTNFQNLTIFKIKLFFYFTICKINILQFENFSNILSIQIISKKWKNTIIKLSKNSSFVISIFATLKFRNFRRSTFRCSKFWPPPTIQKGALTSDHSIVHGGHFKIIVIILSP